MRQGSMLENLLQGLLVVMLGFASAAVVASPDPPDAPDASPAEREAAADGRAIARTLMGGEPSALWPRLGDELRALIGSAEALDQMGAHLRAHFGPEQEVLSERVTLGEGGYQYRRVARHALDPTPLAWDAVVTGEGVIEGLRVAPDAGAAPTGDLPEVATGRLPDSAWVQARLDTLTGAQARFPGVVVGLVDGDGRRFVASGDAGDGAPPDRHTVFAAGSITKGLTGLLLAQMIDAGDVRAQQTIGSLFPDPSTLPPTLAGITLEELATHRSGLPRLSRGAAMAARMLGDDPYAGSTAEEIFADTAAVPDDELAARRGRFVYSNLGMALLGQLLAHAAGTDYAELLAQRVFAPLGLGTPALDATSVKGRAAVGRSNGEEVPAWRLDAYAPAGAWRASAEVMLDLGERLLAKQPEWVGQALAVRAEDHGTAVGLGWIHGRAGQREIIWHNGGTAGFSSFLAIVPEEQLVVVVLANGPGGVDALAMELLGARP